MSTPTWRSRFLRYIDTRPNGDALRKCILSGPYKSTTVIVQVVAAIDDSLAVPKHTTVETPMNMSPANKAHFESEKEANHLILTGIGDELYSIVDACQIAQEMWEAIERLQQGKEIAKPITPPSESASEEDSDPRQAQRDKDMQKNLALIVKVKDFAYHKEKMLLCKQAEKDTDEEIDEQELEAHYSYMAKIQEVPTANTGTDSEPLEMTEFKKYKPFNDRTIDYDKLEHKLNATLKQLAQKDIEIKEGLKLKAYEILVVKEKHEELIKQSLLTKSHYEGLVKQKTKVITNLKLKEEHEIDKMLSMEKQLKFLNEIVYKKSQYIQTIHMMAPKVPKYNGRPIFANPRYLKQAQSEIPCLYAFPYDQYTHANRLIPDGEETLALERENRFRAPTAQDMDILIKTCLMPLALKTQNDSFIFVHELKQEMHDDLKYVESFENEIDELKSDKAEFSNMYDMILTLNANAVCATCGKCLVDSDHFACVTKMLNDVNARTKKPNVVLISNRKPKGHANKSVATPHKKKVASKSTTQKPKSYYRMMCEKSSKAWKWWIEQQCPSGYKWIPKTKMQWVPKAKNENVQKIVSFAIDNASRITNVLKRTNSIGSNFSNVPSSSNSLADYTTHPIHF
nr:hypothetical protein [Tanacetum cinerariifolium]